MQDFEKLGVFYLGSEVDHPSGRATERLLLYDSRDLTTHALIVGMTGSGKTGLAVALLEEAAIDGIPAIAIDPKGDLGNLLLAFPELSARDFEPWIDPGEAQRRGLSPADLAAEVAERWRSGLAQSGQDPARIARYAGSAEAAIYTPGSSAGIPLAMLRSFAAPPADERVDGEATSERIQSAVSGLLALVGVAADPFQSREAILLAILFKTAWAQGAGLSLADLVRQVQSPPFRQLGVLDLETFYPARERAQLALALNALLAAPDSAPWLEGEPLDVQRLLWTPEGRPRLSVVSIAHLSDAQRMSFVTVLLGEVVAWMRRQSGTSSLRAILYMDEIFGFFPPTAEPPSKRPMLTLLKQARAYGLGVVLATQNPVDLDYKGLANAGTWFLGRLQTERDKQRVLDGLEGALASGGKGFDRGALDRALSGLESRVFLMNDVHEDAPVVFRTRWALSYLRGPLTRPQIQALMASRRAARPAPVAPETRPPDAPAEPVQTGPAPEPTAARPALPPEANESFAAPLALLSTGGKLVYRPLLAAECRLHFVDARSRLDLWQTASVRAPLSEVDVLWERAEVHEGALEPPAVGPLPGAAFAPLPPAAGRAKSYEAWSKGLASHLYQTRTLALWRSPELKLVSRPGEARGDFVARLGLAARESRDADLDDLRRRYAPKRAAQEERIRRAEERVGREEAQQAQARTGSMIAVGTSLLGALLGRRTLSSANAGRAGSAARSLGRIGKEQGDVERARGDLEAERAKLADLERSFQADAAAVRAGAGEPFLEEIAVRPRKGDIALGKLSLLWVPWVVGGAGPAEPA